MKKREEKRATARFSSETFARNSLAIQLSGVFVAFVLLALVGRSFGDFEFKVSEFADVVAALSAGLAFIWLVTGYFQQGQELRNTVNALVEQVDQQVKLVDATNSAAERQREAVFAARDLERRRNFPLLEHDVEVPSNDFGDRVISGIFVRNLGQSVFRLRCEIETFDDDKYPPYSIYLQNLMNGKFAEIYDGRFSRSDQKIAILIEYTTFLDEVFAERWIFEPNDDESLRSVYKGRALMERRDYADYSQY